MSDRLTVLDGLILAGRDGKRLVAVLSKMVYITALFEDGVTRRMSKKASQKRCEEGGLVVWHTWQLAQQIGGAASSVEKKASVILWMNQGSKKNDRDILQFRRPHHAN